MLKQLYPWEIFLGTHWKGGWVDPRASPNVLSLPEIKSQFLGCPFDSLVTILTVISQSANWLMTWRFPCMHHDVIWGNGGVPPLILNLDTKQSQWWAYALAALPLKREPQAPINKEVGWAPKLVCTLIKRDKILAPARNRTMIAQRSSL